MELCNQNSLGEKGPSIGACSKEAVSIEETGLAGTSPVEDYVPMIESVKKFVRDYQFDPNSSSIQLYSHAQSLIDNNSGPLDLESWQRLSERIQAEEQLRSSDSSYAEVRSIVPPIDDTTLRVNTFRVWFLGTIFTVLGTGLNEFFSDRYPSIWVTSSVAQLVSFPCGVAMAKYLPTHNFGLGRWSMTLNPGAFNQKEHILIAVMANVAFNNGTAYVTTVFVMLKLDIFFGPNVMVDSILFRILSTLSTQFVGLGCAGIARRFLVYPPAMIWPSALAQIALSRALHNDDGQFSVPGWKMSRQKFLVYSFVGMFCYFWLPGYLFQALSFFNWPTWIAPDNVTLAVVTGSLCGLGLNPWPTFDWNIVTTMIDPIVSPFFCTVNYTSGVAIAAFLFAPLLYWNNLFKTAYLPITSYLPFNKFGSFYNVSKILGPDYMLDVTAYEAYSVPYLSAGRVITFAAGFATLPALICHAVLYYWTDLKIGLMAAMKRKHSREGHDDIHNRLMKVYPEVPEWWFTIILVASFVLGCIVCLCYDIGLPIWCLFLAFALVVVFQIPLGIMAAVTNIFLALNVLSPLIAGYAVPNKPIANMFFKTYATNGCIRSLAFSQDLKLGHYLKVPPRIMFAAQVYATFLCVFVSIGVNAWQMSNIKDYCKPTQSAHFICPGSNTFFNAAVIWGVVGPKRLFGRDGLYSALPWAFLLGAVLPIPVWLVARRFPTSFVRYINIPVILAGFLVMSPYNFSFVWPACVVGFVFNFYIKRRHLAWWLKYAYVLTSSLRVAIAVSGVIIFFAVQFRNVPVDWWGNTVSFDGVDGGSASAPRCVLKVLADGEAMPGT